MKLLTSETDYDLTIKLARDLQGEYEKPVIFHCFWNGILNEKHLYSIMSCYYFNVLNNKHKIILWLENNAPNQYNTEISKYCEIRQFSLAREKYKTGFLQFGFKYKKSLSYYSDVVRYLLLYNYGGCWFDLDCLILRSFDPIFINYGDQICVYRWANENYPNGAIYISLTPRCPKLKSIIKFIINRQKGWGFQEAQLTFELPLDFLVLPCSWFDPDWIPNCYNIGCICFFKNSTQKYSFDNFFEGAFCYHWHNKWYNMIEESSPFMQLMNIIIQNLEKK